MNVPFHFEKLSAFDLDGTIVRGNSSFLFFQRLVRENFFSKWDAFKILPSVFLYKTRRITLNQLHNIILKRCLIGFKETLLEDRAQIFVNELEDSFFYDPVMRRIESAKAENHALAILSSSPHWLVKSFAKRLGIPYFLGTQYDCIQEGIASIRLLVDGNIKAHFCKELSLELNIKNPSIYAYSDSMDDLPFLRSSGSSIVVTPSYALKKIAQKMNWEFL